MNGKQALLPNRNCWYIDPISTIDRISDIRDDAAVHAFERGIGKGDDGERICRINEPVIVIGATSLQHSLALEIGSDGEKLLARRNR